MTESSSRGEPQGLRARLHEVIFGTETPAGRAFDVIVLWAILLSVLTVMLESVAGIRQRHGPPIRAMEWFFTVLFTVEYILRIYSTNDRKKYIFSFFGAVDLLAVIPTYLSVVIEGTQSLIVIRALRLLRVFRILKLGQYSKEARVLLTAMRSSRAKITVFLGTVLTTVVIIGAAMYLVEGEASGFTSIPIAMYWAIVTMTTVGYGDIAPVTVLGQFLAAILMVLGYGIIAVPTGIVSAELVHAGRADVKAHHCGSCGAAGHDHDAAHCKYCGAPL